MQTAHMAQEPGWDTTSEKTIKDVNDVKRQAVTYAGNSHQLRHQTRHGNIWVTSYIWHHNQLDQKQPFNTINTISL